MWWARRMRLSKRARSDRETRFFNKRMEVVGDGERSAGERPAPRAWLVRPVQREEATGYRVSVRWVDGHVGVGCACGWEAG